MIMRVLNWQQVIQLFIVSSAAKSLMIVLIIFSNKGLIITVVVILAIFFISTLTGRHLFYVLLLGFIILMLCVAAITWVHKQKRLLRKNQITSPISDRDMHIRCTRFNTLHTEQSSSYF